MGGTTRGALAFGLVAAALGWSGAGLADDGNGFSGKVWTGIEYDSNVAVLEVDQSAGEGDFAGLFEAELAYQRDLTAKLGLNLSYGFFQSLQFDFSDFNIRTHLVMADLSHKIGRGRAGVLYLFADAALAGDGFLDIHQGTLYGESMVGERGYLRGSYAYADKSYALDPRRNGQTHQGALDAYYFFNQARTYASAGYLLTDEQTRDPQFTYLGHQIKARIVHKMQAMRKELKLEAGASWELRNFDAFPTVSQSAAASTNVTVIEELREDERVRLQIAAEQVLADHVSLRLAYEHNILGSTLPAVDFTENVLAMKIGYGF